MPSSVLLVLQSVAALRPSFGMIFGVGIVP
jgi:hypothetical protein